MIIEAFDRQTGSDPMSMNAFKRAVYKQPPHEFTIEILPPQRQGGNYSYGMRIHRIRSGSSTESRSSDSRASIMSTSSFDTYEIWRRWEDCLFFQDTMESLYAQLSREKRMRLVAGKGVKKNGLYQHELDPIGRQHTASSFDSLPPGPDPRMIAKDLHQVLPKLTKKGTLFRPSIATVEHRQEEFKNLIEALWSNDDDVPTLIQEMRQMRVVRDFFGFWRRDFDRLEKEKQREQKDGKQREKASGVSDTASISGSSTLHPSTASSAFGRMRRPSTSGGTSSRTHSIFGTSLGMYFSASNLSLQLPSNSMTIPDSPVTPSSSEPSSSVVRVVKGKESQRLGSRNGGTRPRANTMIGLSVSTAEEDLYPSNSPLVPSSPASPTSPTARESRHAGPSSSRHGHHSRHSPRSPTDSQTSGPVPSSSRTTLPPPASAPANLTFTFSMHDNGSTSTHTDRHIPVESTSSPAVSPNANVVTFSDPHAIAPPTVSSPPRSSRYRQGTSQSQTQSAEKPFVPHQLIDPTPEEEEVQDGEDIMDNFEFRLDICDEAEAGDEPMRIVTDAEEEEEDLPAVNEEEDAAFVQDLIMKTHEHLIPRRNTLDLIELELAAEKLMSQGVNLGSSKSKALLKDLQRLRMEASTTSVAEEPEEGPASSELPQLRPQRLDSFSSSENRRAVVFASPTSEGMAETEDTASTYSEDQVESRVSYTPTRGAPHNSVHSQPAVVVDELAQSPASLTSSSTGSFYSDDAALSNAAAAPASPAMSAASTSYNYFTPQTGSNRASWISQGLSSEGMSSNDYPESNAHLMDLSAHVLAAFPDQADEEDDDDEANIPDFTLRRKGHESTLTFMTECSMDAIIPRSELSHCATDDDGAGPAGCGSEVFGHEYDEGQADQEASTSLSDDRASPSSLRRSLSSGAHSQRYDSKRFSQRSKSSSMSAPSEYTYSTDSGGSPVDSYYYGATSHLSGEEDFESDSQPSTPGREPARRSLSPHDPKAFHEHASGRFHIPWSPSDKRSSYDSMSSNGIPPLLSPLTTASDAPSSASSIMSAFSPVSPTPSSATSYHTFLSTSTVTSFVHGEDAVAIKAVFPANGSIVAFKIERTASLDEVRLKVFNKLAKQEGAPLRPDFGLAYVVSAQGAAATTDTKGASRRPRSNSISSASILSENTKLRHIFTPVEWKEAITSCGPKLTLHVLDNETSP